MKESINNTKLHAILHYVTPPSDKQNEVILDFLEKKYGPSELELVTDLSLKGGFILYAGADVYDWSVKGRVEQLRKSLGLSISDAAGINPLIKE